MYHMYQIQLPSCWAGLLADEFDKPYFSDIMRGLSKKKATGEIIYPTESEIFTAFTVTLFDQIKVVILGQDPYHGLGQAHGLSFSVKDGVRIPPSLGNIFKEVKSDIGGDIPISGNLTHRAEQGVFLLNSILTVTASHPGSHQDLGRQKFTDAVISKISQHKEGVIFLLRGNFAALKASLIDEKKHTILLAPHPSPFSAYKGFLGCRHFSKTNEILKNQGKDIIKR